MTTTGKGRASYAVPRYRAAGDSAFYHVLHGAVPGHQIDFIYCPAVPQGPLTQVHIGHMARLLKHIEPREKAAFAFAIGNLSRDDVQHEPGHGGLALLLCRRAHGVLDHAGRVMPPYAHGLMAIDRALDRRALIDAALAFHGQFMDEAPGAAGGFYLEYTRAMRAAPRSVEQLLGDHIARFQDLPRPGESNLGADFHVEGGAPPARVTVVIPDGEPFSTHASVAASLAAVLYRSNVKWTAISTGREVDVPGGLSVRLVPESEAPRDARGPVFHLADLTEDEAGIAERLFSAKPRKVVLSGHAGWREQYARRAGHVLPSAAAAAAQGLIGGPVPVEATNAPHAGISPGGDSPAADAPAADGARGPGAPAEGTVSNRVLPEPPGADTDALEALLRSRGRHRRQVAMYGGAAVGVSALLLLATMETQPEPGGTTPASTKTETAAPPSADESGGGENPPAEMRREDKVPDPADRVSPPPGSPRGNERTGAPSTTRGQLPDKKVVPPRPPRSTKEQPRGMGLRAPPPGETESAVSKDASPGPEDKSKLNDPRYRN